MIAHIYGNVIDIRAIHIVVDVSGLGHLVAVRNPSSFTLKQTIALHTHLAVRETALDLYGFETRDELEMFELLLTLPKIGPKSAMQIMSQADLELLKKAVLSEDPSYLSKMSGIGKKTAENIVAGLKDKLDYGDDIAVGSESAGDSDVLDALLALGYTQKDARDVLQKIAPDITDTNARIKEALKLIGTK